MAVAKSVRRQLEQASRVLGAKELLEVVTAEFGPIGDIFDMDIASQLGQDSNADQKREGSARRAACACQSGERRRHRGHQLKREA